MGDADAGVDLAWIEEGSSDSGESPLYARARYLSIAPSPRSPHISDTSFSQPSIHGNGNCVWWWWWWCCCLWWWW